MGSISPPVLPIKRDPPPRNNENNNSNYNNVQIPRSRFGRFMVFKKIDYLPWISAIAVFIFFMFLFQLFLPLSMVEKFDGDFLKGREEGNDSDVNLLKEIGGLDFGEDLKFVPTKLMMKFQREKRVVNNVSFDNGSRTVMRFGNRKPQLALLRDRSDQSRGTWEEGYNAKKVDRNKIYLQERDDGELERTGQPLCIYEFGQGSWHFLHCYSLYRGIGLSLKGRRSRRDDIDAPSRLPLLNTPYYRDTLGDFGAFFAIANRVDRIHKNAWIGFFSWRATARQESLSENGEIALLEDIEAQKHGDAVYFWVRMDKDPRNPNQKGFWSFCDAINAGNCKFAFSEALKNMYGIKDNSTVLPPMPVDGDTWSVMHSWAMPTKSFLEFVMFSRMFVDALDAQVYDEHHTSGLCYLSLSQDKHCYSRVLEILVNVWAYHSSRRMVYINPKTGMIQEQHALKKRKGKMLVKWFGYSTLNAMDEDLAEEADSEAAGRWWLWPATGEVLWPVLKTINVRSAFNSLMYTLLENPTWVSHLLFVFAVIATVATITVGQRRCLRAASVCAVFCYIFWALARLIQSLVTMAISIWLGAVALLLCLCALVIEDYNRNTNQLPQPTVDDQPTSPQPHSTVDDQPTSPQVQSTMEIEQPPPVLNFVTPVRNFVTLVLDFMLQFLNFSRNSGDRTDPASGDRTDPASGDAGR